MSHDINIARIRAVSNALEELKDEVVFVGGATVSLYASRTAVETDVKNFQEISSRGLLPNEYDFTERQQKSVWLGVTPATDEEVINAKTGPLIG